MGSNHCRRIACISLLGLLMAAGCTRTSLRDLPFLRAAEKKDVSFDKLAQPKSVSLTIWHDSFESAQLASQESGKPILADFTGSDWCTWCIKLKKDVFETREFEEWAKDNVVLLELDYPKRSMQSPAIKKQNKELAARYQINSYPTVLLIDPNGEVLGKLGYMSSPSDWIAAAIPMLARQGQSTDFR